MRDGFRRWVTTNWPVLLQAFLALALLVALLIRISPLQVLAALSGAKPFWLLLGLGLFVLADVLRALRFAILLTTPVSARRLLPVVIIQGLANVVFPARLGELSYLYLLRSRDRVSVVDSLPSLALARLADAWALLCLLLLAISLAPSNIPSFMINLTMILGVLMSGASGLVLVLARHRVAVAQRVVQLLAPWSERGWPGRFQSRLDDVLRGLEMASSPYTASVAFAFSLFIWLSASLVPYCLFRAIGLSLPLQGVLYAAVLIQFLAFVPIHFMGGLGTLDASWAAFLMLFDLPQEQAIVAALAAHMVFYAFVGVESLGGILALLWMRPQASSSPENPG